MDNGTVINVILDVRGAASSSGVRQFLQRKLDIDYSNESISWTLISQTLLSELPRVESTLRQCSFVCSGGVVRDVVVVSSLLW